MKTSSAGDLDGVLNEFVNKLLLKPLENQRFIATFILNGISCGEVYFRQSQSQRIANAAWKAFVHEQDIRAELIYNGNFSMLNDEAVNVRTALSQLPIF